MRWRVRRVAAPDCQQNWEQAEALLPGAGEIRMWALSTAPDGWAACDGSICPEGELRTKLLADGSPHGTSGGLPLLPDFRGRAPIGVGTGTGLTARALGAAVGVETHALTPAETPLRSHTHSGTTGNDSPDHSHDLDYNTRFVPGNAGLGTFNNYEVPAAGLADSSTGGREGFHQHPFTTGTPSVAEANGSAHQNMQPSRAINFIIKL